MMKNNNLELDFRRSFFYIFFGFIFFSILFYFRVIRVRVPRELYTNLNWILIIIYTFMIGLFIYLIIKTIRKIVAGAKDPEPIKNKSLSFIISYVNLANMYFYESLKNFDTYLKWKLFGENYGLFLIKISEFIFKYMKFSYRRYPSWIFIFIPRVIVSIVFFIDVVYFNYMEYFYKILSLVLITLIYQYILYCLRTFAEGNITLHQDDVYFYEYKNNIPEKIFISDYLKYKMMEAHGYKNAELLFQEKYLCTENLKKFNFSFSEKYMKEEKEFFKYASEEEINARTINYYLKMHKWWIYLYIFILSSNMYKDDIDGPKFLLITYCLYFMSWSYMLLYGLVNIT